MQQSSCPHGYVSPQHYSTKTLHVMFPCVWPRKDVAAKSTSRCLSLAALATKRLQIKSKASILNQCCPRKGSQMDLGSKMDLGSQRKLMVSFLDISCFQNVAFACMGGSPPECGRHHACCHPHPSTSTSLSQSLLWERGK